MTYDETKELAKNVEITNKAEKICKDFKDNVTLSLKNYKGDGIFSLWSDSHNEIFLDVSGTAPIFQCRYLHNSYDVRVSPAGVFSAIKKECRGAEHLASFASNPY